MKKHAWQKYLSLVLSFVIVFNVTMISAFADENDNAAASQKEQVESEAPSDEEAAETEQESEETPEETTGVASEETQQEGEESSDGEQAEEQSPEEESEPAEKSEEVQSSDTEDEPVEAPEEAEPEEQVGGKGKYVKDVYIAYGKTEDEAKDWLRKHKWEPLTGNADFNAGKASAFDKDVAAVMGIRRTDNEDEAITDMAVMNMKGGYSFPDYQTLLKEKKAEINEFINSFIPVLEEYRKNYTGKGSDAGKQRAELAHELLNKFYDGGKDDPYKANDTGKPLGDLLLEKVKQEGNEGGGDLQQIIMESSAPAVTIVEVCLALAADAEETNWIERLEGLSGDELAKNLSKYVPEAKGQDVAPSAVNKFLKQHFGDQAKVLASQWDTIHQKMIWFEEFNEKNDLWQHDGESEEDYAKRIGKYFEELDKKSKDGISEEHKNYTRTFAIYAGLYEVPYKGEWGETLGDFFNPAEGAGYSDNVAAFMPIAAALSKGQRAAAELVSLESLLMIGMGTEESIKDLFPQIKEVFGDADELSIYEGMNRGIFRGGVALTSAALMEKNQSGSDPFGDMWSFEGMYNIMSYAAAITGIVMIGAGFGYLRYIKGTGSYGDILDSIQVAQSRVNTWKETLRLANTNLEKAKGRGLEGYRLDKYTGKVTDAENSLYSEEESLAGYRAEASGMTLGARVVMGIGGALIIAAAFAKGYQLYEYYHRTFTQIPTYIVDEADIVSYEKDEEGNERKLINFDQYVYYSAVRCNRQEVGEIGDWQSGVSDYASWGCGDAADLNGDYGQQWLALYTVKSERKGFPILADSLTLQYGSKDMPKGTTRGLHMFTYENATDLGDTAYSFNNKKNGVYFFWDVDEKAFKENDTASAFGGGTTALAGGLGLLIGIIGTALVMRKKKGKEQ